MRVVDDDLRTLAGVAGDDALHPPRHGGQHRARTRRVGERHAERAQRGDRAQQVARVVVADQRRRDRDALVALDDVERQAIPVVAEIARAQARLVAADRDGPAIELLPGQVRGELDALRVVKVDDRGAQPGPCEQLRLRLPVLAHVAVVVEMVLAEVGEHSHRDAGAGKTVLDDSDRGRLERARREPALDEIVQRVL